VDVPSSPVGGGTVSDIVSFSVTDPYNTFTEADLFIGGIASTPLFTWNPSEITSMDVVANTYIGGPDDEYINFSNTGLSDAYYFLGFAYDGGSCDTGSWVSTVPDSASGGALLGLAFAGLGACRRYRP
jgi:hypothetical protein